MKKLLLFLLFLSGIANAQIVNIPDANFKAKLLYANTTNSIASTYYDNTNYNVIPQTWNKLDVNNDGEIQYSEVQNIQVLYVPNSNISDLTGIEAFVNLKALYCNNNNQLSSVNITQNLGLRELYSNSCGLTSLNVAQNSNLRWLNCDYNQISSLNVSQNQYLEKLYCRGNLLTQINITQNLALNDLWIDSNQLSVLDISQNLQLIRLNCSLNLLTNINVVSHQWLEYLVCSGNQLGSVNVSQNSNLKVLDCYNTGITSIDVTSNSVLESLTVGNDQIVSLNVTQNPNLKSLACNLCQLTSLDISQNPNLQILRFEDNQISTINLANQPNLLNIQCSGGSLTALDVSQNTNLQTLVCWGNNLTNLDVSQNTKLSTFSCMNNQLQTLNIKNGKIESTLYLNGNPNLQYVCADEAQIASVQAQVGSSVLVSSYCSFVPGGNYNTVSGTINFDYNNDGCGIGDAIFKNSLSINLSNGSVSSGTFPSSNGNYLLFTTTGSHTLSASVENPNYFTITPSSVAINFPLLNNSVATQNFCITPNGVHPDLEVVIVPLLPARPGFDAVYEIVYKNKGNQNLSGSVSFQFNDANLDFVSATTVPNSQTSGNLVWNYNNLMPFESRSVKVTLNVNSPMETPTVNIGDVLNFIAIANPVSGDETTSDNTFQYNQTVVGAFDPNDKTCLEGNIVSPTKIGDYLHYNINFENTGNYPAENIVVKDVIDVSKFDINTLQVLNASHMVKTRMSGSKVEFIFENINLGANQKGNVVFKIKTKSNLAVGNSVSNKADIYFDYNYPIITNTATTTFQALSNSSFVKDYSISIYPNPTNSIINIKCNTTIKSIELLDVQGRILIAKMTSDNNDVLDISDKTNGIYFLRITSENGIKVEKLIKE